MKTIYYSFVLWVILYTLQLRCKEAVEVVEEPKNSTLLTAHILCQVYGLILSTGVHGLNSEMLKWEKLAGFIILKINSFLRKK